MIICLDWKIESVHMKNKFAQRMRELRKENGLTQNQVAKMMGLSESAIAKYEQGKNEPSLVFLISIAKFFKTTTDDLLGLED